MKDSTKTNLLNTIEEAKKIFDNFIVKCSEKLDKLRKKYGVPASGKHYNSGTGAIISKLRSGGLDRGPWVAPSSQADRYSALAKAGAGSWKGGMLMVMDGDLKYPFINKSGKAMVSGIYAAKQRASAAGESAVVKICTTITDAIQKDLDKKDKKKK